MRVMQRASAYLARYYLICVHNHETSIKNPRLLVGRAGWGRLQDEKTPSGINAGLAAFFTRSGGAGRRRNDRVLRFRYCRSYPLRGWFFRWIDIFKPHLLIHGNGIQLDYFFIEPGNIHTRKETCINLFNRLNGVKP